MIPDRKQAKIVLLLLGSGIIRLRLGEAMTAAVLAAAEYWYDCACPLGRMAGVRGIRSSVSARAREAACKREIPMNRAYRDGRSRESTIS